jgi:hypothetical protein
MATPFSTNFEAFSQAPFDDSSARREELKTGSTMCDDRKKEVTVHEETLSKLDTAGDTKTGGIYRAKIHSIYEQESGFSSNGNQTPDLSQQAFNKEQTDLAELKPSVDGFWNAVPDEWGTVRSGKA